MLNFPLPRVDTDNKLRELLLPYCRIKHGEIYVDKTAGHKIACIDSTIEEDIYKLTADEKPVLAIHDPPYNFVAFVEKSPEQFAEWCHLWIELTYKILAENSSLYIWLGADQNKHYQPLPQFMLMMQSTGFKSKSFITMRNQRGYGTQKNWMAVRQELLFYIKGEPEFNIKAEYTDIPKVLKGYYKTINGEETENLERSKSANIRAGNVWLDIQQVFYRMEENVNGCYAQKPMKAIERIINSGSSVKDIVIDFFSHSGTTLIASEKLNRICFTADYDPVYCEITLRRLENYRSTGRTGWQNSNPFMNEIIADDKIRTYLKKNYNYSFEKEKEDGNNRRQKDILSN
jgi:site-specific DNA-methyltransferase (adenine-specific)